MLFWLIKILLLNNVLSNFKNIISNIALILQEEGANGKGNQNQCQRSPI